MAGPVASASSSTDDMTSIERAALGDQAAFAEFYDEVSSVVFGTTLKVLRNRAIAEEVTQEVFLELWRRAGTFDRSKGTPVAWAATVARRRAVDRVRSEEAARAREDVDAQSDAHSTARDRDVVLDEVTTGFERREVVAALDLLTDKQREAVDLAYYGGHTYREVAAILDVPEGTIKTRIRDALIRMRTSLGGRDDH